MSSEKRLALTLVLTLGSVYGIQYVMLATGLIKPEPPAVQIPIAEGDPAKDQDKAREKAKLAEANKPKGELPENVFAPDVDPVPPVVKLGPKRARPSELVIGSDEDDSPNAYHLRLQLTQKGAAVAVATSANDDAELDPLEKERKGRRPRLELIGETSPDAPGSLSMTVISTEKAPRPVDVDPENPATEAAKVEAPLDTLIWEVVRDKDDAPAVRTITKTDPTTQTKVEGQEIAFRTTAADPSVTVTKIYRIWKGENGFNVELRFVSPKKDSQFTYRLFGPHGIPIEGESYTSTFRDVFFGEVKTAGGKPVMTARSSTDIVKYKNEPSYRLSVLPLMFAGVENQYYATFVQPIPIPTTQDERKDQESAPVLFAEDVKAPQKSDIGIEILSKPIRVGPNLGEEVRNYWVYAGPKTAKALTPFGAEDLATYRKQFIPIPYAPELATYVIAPLLEKIYELTRSVARLMGWQNGNYGIAIILLTMTVRMIMFPLGRKQAMMAKKMQDLQPVLAEVKEKYKDDKEALTRETMAVWKRHKVNPAAGCIPALIQMPIFVGLWQCLNNSVALRHSKFLYIEDLAAPDMLLKLPFSIPFINFDYLNLLPFLVVGLMLVQTKLFAPPPTTPEAEMNQKMMKYMMIFMAFMFYKVPSGLGLYFITSSSWQICERLLLPKVISNQPKPASEGDELGDKGKGRGSSGPGGSGTGNGPGSNGGATGKLGKWMEKLLEEAAKDKTIRNTTDREADRDRGSRDRDRSRPKPRPGKRR